MHTSSFDTNPRSFSPPTKEKPQQKQRKASKKRDTKGTKSESQIRGLEVETAPPLIAHIISLEEQISDTRAKMREQKLKFVEIITSVVKYLDEKGVSSEEVADYLARLYPSLYNLEDEAKLLRKKEAIRAQQLKEEAAKKESESKVSSQLTEGSQVHLETSETPSKKIRVRKNKQLEEGTQKDEMSSKTTSVLRKTAYETFVGERKSSSKKSSAKKSDETSKRKSKKMVDLEELEVSNINRLQDLAENSGGSVSTIEEPRPIVSPYFQPKVTEPTKEFGIFDNLKFGLAEKVMDSEWKPQEIEPMKSENIISNGKLSGNPVSGDIEHQQYEHMKMRGEGIGITAGFDS